MKTRDRLPSIIILWAMEQQFTRDVADLTEKKVGILLQNEIEAILKANIYDDEIDLPEQVYENVSMGILLGDEKYTNPLSLLYRVKNNLNVSRSKKISSCELLRWIERQEIMDFLLQKISTSSIIVARLLHKGQNREKKVKLEEESGKKDQRIQDYQSGKENRKNIHYSPASTDKSQQRYSRNADDEADPSHSADNIQQSDLFEVLKNTYSSPSCREAKEDIYNQNDSEKHQLKNQPEKSLQNHRRDKLIARVEENEANESQKRKCSEESLNQVEESEANPYTLLRLTEGHQNDEGQDNLMSQVSSFARESDFLNMNLYELEDTSKYGHLLYGDKIDKILRNFMSQDSNFLLIKWLPRKNGFVPLESILETAILKEHCPRILIQFYEEQFKP